VAAVVKAITAVEGAESMPRGEGQAATKLLQSRLMDQGPIVLAKVTDSTAERMGTGW